MSKSAFWASITLLVVGVVVVLMLLVKSSGNLGTGAVATLKTPMNSSDWVSGNSSAKAVLVEYADFQCPACASYHPLVAELKKDFPNDLAVVYRHFPLPQHKNAISAALVAEAAGKQGKFWEMSEILYTKQTEWSDLSDATEVFAGYAQSLSLDLAKFSADIKDQALASKVDDQKLDGVKNGVNSTPTFFLNGVKLINPRSYESFKELVQKEVDGAASQQ